MRPFARGLALGALFLGPYSETLNEALGGLLESKIAIERVGVLAPLAGRHLQPVASGRPGLLLHAFHQCEPNATAALPRRHADRAQATERRPLDEMEDVQRGETDNGSVALGQEVPDHVVIVRSCRADSHARPVGRARVHPYSPWPLASRRRVRARMRRSRRGERWSTYHTSSSLRSSHGIPARPFT